MHIAKSSKRTFSYSSSFARLFVPLDTLTSCGKQIRLKLIVVVFLEVVFGPLSCCCVAHKASRPLRFLYISIAAWRLRAGSKLASIPQPRTRLPAHSSFSNFFESLVEPVGLSIYLSSHLSRPLPHLAGHAPKRRLAYTLSFITSFRPLL